MAMTITVSSYLLESIFRLLDYLDRHDDHDGMHFHKAGYAPRLENDTSLWELKLKIRRLQEQIMETYLQSVDDVTEDERNDLLEWVAAGKSIYDNPCFIYDDSGQTMDFINACRIADEMDADSYDSECMDDNGPF
jgi:hypothetical protein